MQNNNRLLGHSIHPMLVIFPLAMFFTSIIFDIAYLSSNNILWASIAYWMLAVGLIGGVLAACFGFLDWVSIPVHTRAKSVATTHGVGNLIVVILFAVSYYMRWRNGGIYATNTPFVLSILGGCIALFTGWLGGELVERMGVGVFSDANVNSSSSLGSVGEPKIVDAYKTGTISNQRKVG